MNKHIVYRKTSLAAAIFSTETEQELMFMYQDIPWAVERLGSYYHNFEPAGSFS